MSDKTIHTFCRICESLCGLEVHVKDNEIIDIQPDKDHITTYGFACPKGLKQHKMYATPDRLRHPMVKRDEQWVESNWKEVMPELGGKIKKIIKDHGPHSVAMYVGTAAGFSTLHPIFAQGFMDGVGSNNLYSSATQDCSNKFAISQRMYGFPFTLTFPDIEHTDFLIIVGANPMVSKWSFLQVPNPSLHIKNIMNRGGKVVVVDPRRTETAKVAKHHMPIRPNTDVFFYLSFLDELVKVKKLDTEWLETHTKDYLSVIQLASTWPAEKTATLTGIPPEDLRQLVKDYSEASSAAIYCSTGVNMGTHGTTAYWIQECINILGGHLDKKGGMLVSKGIIDFPNFGKKNGTLLRKDRSRLHQFHSTNDAFPGGLLADEILTEGDGQIKAVIVTGGNPLITMANANRLRKAFSSLELLVTLDIYPNETGMIGDYMLPCTSPLERPDLPFIFPLMLGLQTKPYLQATDKVITPIHQERDEASIYLDLCRHSGVSFFGSRLAQMFLMMISRFYSFFTKKPNLTVPQKTILNLILKLCKQKSFKSLLKYKHGVLLDDHQPGSFVPDRVLTSDQKIHMAPPELLRQTERLDAFFKEEMAKKNQFKLITKRDVTTHNSWTHNIDEFTEGSRSTNYAYMHEDDIRDLGLTASQLIKVSTKTGSIVLPIRMNNDLTPRTIAVPHGWGHQSTGMKVARQTTGVNVNILAADGIQNIEPVSGMSHLTGLDVTIDVYEDQLAPHSWSGLVEDELIV